eukprot:TRINITY_DN19888_c0_g1_i1.p1 TRINITY_DN19888_c0_g1~~TRINITY_DN19888_c0_g1_i1.p1  ORF type:complete len:629 (+),score=306.66 TRINITY_DN19888_c0_g1_i1:51-1937(+)
MGTMNDEQFAAEVQKITAKAAEEPPNQNVFLYKHEARSLMTDLRTKLTDLTKAAAADRGAHDALLGKLVKVNMMIAANLFEVESFPEAYEYIERSECMMQALRDRAPYDWEQGFVKEQLEKTRTRLAADVDHDHTATIIELFNMAGYYWCGRGKIEKALTLLRHSEAIYKHFDAWAKQQAGDTGAEGLSVDDTGKVDEAGGAMAQLRAGVETAYTSTLFYNAQVYGDAKKADQASKYCHLTMQRQLVSKKEFDRMEWAINALGLCSFYLQSNDYGASLHCIQAAEKVMETANQAEDAEKYGQTMANIHQAHAKWALYLLKYYSDEIEGLPEDADEPTPPTTLPVEWWCNFTCDIPEPSQPAPLRGGLEGRKRAMEYYAEARRRFDMALDWYKFEDFVTDHIAILQDISALLKVTTTWEYKYVLSDRWGGHIDRLAAIHMARATFLEGVPGQLSEQHYLNYCRQCWYEVAEIYNEVAELRVSQRLHFKDIKGEINGTAPLKKKAINKLMKKGAKYFDQFAGTFEGDDGKAPADMDPDFCSPYVSAKMHSIRLRSKFYATKPEDEYRQLELASVEYTELAAWADAHPKKEKFMQDGGATKLQIDLARDMSALLEGKCRDLRAAYMGRARN